MMNVQKYIVEKNRLRKNKLIIQLKRRCAEMNIAGVLCMPHKPHCILSATKLTSTQKKKKIKSRLIIKCIKYSYKNITTKKNQTKTELNGK